MTTDSTGDWTPERERAIRERCEKATPPPWEANYAYNNGGMPTGDFKIPAHNSGATAEMLVDDAYFCAHARADLPAALAEIERLRDLLREADKAPAEKCARCDKPAGETAVRDGVDTLCMACSIDDLDGRDIDDESGSR